MNPEWFLDSAIPGSDLVGQGYRDIHAGIVTPHALMVQLVAPRMKRLSIEVPSLPVEGDQFFIPVEHRLYDALDGKVDFSQYNAINRRLVSFVSTLEEMVRRGEGERKG